MTAKSILVVYAGGTIGMVPGQNGLVPGHAFSDRIEAWIADNCAGTFRHRIMQLDPLIDSANADARTWHHLADQLWRERDTFDAAILLHGTDTLSYTASALSFLLAGLGKPVILTGAQIPFSAANSDAEANLRGAVTCAAADIHEVCIFFDGVLMRGNRSRKWGTQRGEGFISPHWPALARIGDCAQIGCPQMDRGQVDRAALLSPSAPRCRPPPAARAASVGLVKVFPGFGSRLLLAAANEYPGGLVLELYGAGTGPAGDPALRRTLETIAGNGVPMIGVSQCARGALNPPLYETGRILAACGVSNGHDLTPEAALTKLHCVRCEADAGADIGALVAKPVAGELTPSFQA